MSENLETEKIEIIKEAFEEKREIIGFAPQGQSGVAVSPTSKLKILCIKGTITTKPKNP